MTLKSHLTPISISAAAYFVAAFGIYSWILDFIDAGLIALPKSMENIFWLLVAAGLSLGVISEVALLVMHRKQFRAISPSEIRKADLVKRLINFSMTLFFSYVIYRFVVSRQPNLRDPLAFFAVAAMVYFATAAFCKNIRYIPLFIIFLRGRHGRI